MTNRAELSSYKPFSDSQFTNLLQRILPSISDQDYSLPFADAGLDSMDLLTLRTELERQSQIVFRDDIWIACQSLTDISKAFSDTLSPPQITYSDSILLDSQKFHTIEMPQMNLMALSEIWLMKELGNMHWEMIAKGLACNSSDLKDENGNRLYATFARIRLQSQVDFSAFKENEQLQLRSKLARWGKNLYLSKALCSSGEKKIQVEMLSSFSIRNHADNTGLSKSQPAASPSNIPEIETYPDFVAEFKSLKTGQQSALKLNEQQISIDPTIIYECEYNLNPYSEINGVGLLYFAAYSCISDSCEAAYMNEHHPRRRAYELSCYTLARDIFFFGNCNLGEKIIYRLHRIQMLDNGLIQLESSLHRKSDDYRMARIFALKKWHD